VLFPLKHLRDVYHSADILPVSGRATRAACVGALVDALTENPALTPCKISFAEGIQDGAEDLGSSCMLLYRDPGSIGAVRPRYESSSDEAA